MASWGRVQPRRSAMACSSFSFACCRRPSSLRILSFSHWYPWGVEVSWRFWGILGPWAGRRPPASLGCVSWPSCSPKNLATALPPRSGSPSARHGSRGGSPRRTSLRRCRRPVGTRSWLRHLGRSRAEQGVMLPPPASPGLWHRGWLALGTCTVPCRALWGLGWDPHHRTYLVEELGELHLHLLPLEHVVLSLLADRRDQVELPGH